MKSITAIALFALATITPIGALANSCLLQGDGSLRDVFGRPCVVFDRGITEEDQLVDPRFRRFDPRFRNREDIPPRQVPRQQFAPRMGFTTPGFSSVR